jgi:RNA polymerase-binding transcription factor DksA
VRLTHPILPKEASIGTPFAGLTPFGKRVVKTSGLRQNHIHFSRPIMTQSELDYYRKRLLDLRRRLLGEVTDVADEALRPTGGDPSGNLSDVPVHPADLSADDFEEETSLGLLENEEVILEETEAALKRIDEGRFGRCQQCGREIPKERLRAIPYTAYCVQCAKRLQDNLKA